MLYCMLVSTTRQLKLGASLGVGGQRHLRHDAKKMLQVAAIKRLCRLCSLQHWRRAVLSVHSCVLSCKCTRLKEHVIS